MSMKLMVAAMNTKVGSPLKKLVLIKLADNANDAGEAWPSYQHIADQCEIDRSTVKRHIKSLEDDGLLKIEARKGPKGNSSNLYTLMIGGGTVNPHGGTVNPPDGGTVNPRTYHPSEPVNEPNDLFDGGGKGKRKVHPDFDDWYQHYPKKVARGQAERAFNRAIKLVDLETLIKATKAYAAKFEGKDRQYIKNPSTWLTGKCWLDDDVPPKNPKNRPESARLLPWEYVAGDGLIWQDTGGTRTKVQIRVNDVACALNANRDLVKLFGDDFVMTWDDYQKWRENEQRN